MKNVTCKSSTELELGNIVPGVFTPVLAKHSKSFNLIDTLAVGVDRIQRNFEPMQQQVEQWRSSQINDDRAKLILYAAFVDGELDAARSLLPEVHRRYFEPEYPEFSPRTMWSLSNAFTSAFKKLDPIPQFKRLLSPTLDRRSAETARLLARRGALHAVRGVLSGTALLLFCTW